LIFNNLKEFLLRHSTSLGKSTLMPRQSALPLSVRAVVERRQSIGVLRAIGFRSSMIRTQFLIESSFITILGIVVGIFLGILQSWLIYNEISKELEGAKFVIPFGEVGILVGLTVIASILASVIPANEASKTYPAEALRYE